MVRIDIAQPPGSFYNADVVAAIRSNVGISADARVVITQSINLTDTTELLLLIQHTGADTGNNPLPTIWAAKLVSDVANTATWTFSILLAKAAVVITTESDVPSYPIIGVVMQYWIPLEPTIVLGILVVIAFLMFASDIFCSKNYVSGDGEELLEALRLRRRRDKEMKYVPTKPPVADPRPADAPRKPVIAWLAASEQQ